MIMIDDDSREVQSHSQLCTSHRRSVVVAHLQQTWDTESKLLNNTCCLVIIMTDFLIITRLIIYQCLNNNSAHKQESDIFQKNC